MLHKNQMTIRFSANGEEQSQTHSSPLAGSSAIRIYLLKNASRIFIPVENHVLINAIIK